jgi:hypothetical protein
VSVFKNNAGDTEHLLNHAGLTGPKFFLNGYTYAGVRMPD